MNLLTYLDHHLLSTDALLSAAHIDSATLHALQQRRMMPLPSYCLQIEIGCTSVFGPHAEQVRNDYYGSGYPTWIADIKVLDNEAAAFALFARRYRLRMPEADDSHLASEWEHFLAGTYGLCTKTGLPEQIADKEMAILIIKSLCEQELGDAERALLRDAVDQLDTASAPFAPHEVARSSRRRYIEEVRQRYDLA